MWRHSVAGVVVTALGLMPSAAIACALSCVDAAGPHPSNEAASAAHAHHDSAAPMGSAGLSVSPSPHDCRDHDVALRAPTAVPRSATMGSPVVLGSGTPPQQQPPGGLTVRSLQSTHGPPDLSGRVNPSVLRL